MAPIAMLWEMVQERVAAGLGLVHISSMSSLGNHVQGGLDWTVDL